MQFDKAYLISLKESKKRREKFFKLAQKASLLVEWFEGVRGSDVDIEEYRKQGYIANDFKLRMPGSLGCLLSHVHVWEKIRNDKDCNIGLIFEDDAIIKKNFVEKISSIPLDSVPKNWDMIWLGWHKINCTSVNSFFGKPNAGRGNSGHFGYLIKSESVDKIKKLLIPYNNLNSKDILLRKNFDKFNAYFLKKKIITTPLMEFDSIRKNLNTPSRENRLIKKVFNFINK